MGKKRELLKELGYEDLTVFEDPDYDNAIIGVSHDDRVIYSFEKMVQCLVKEDKMTEEEAIDFIGYNTIRAIPYFPNGPIVLMDELLFENEEQDCSEIASVDNLVQGNDRLDNREG